MMKTWERLDLQLFDGGAAAAGTGEGAGATGGGETGTDAASQRANKNALAGVHYGVEQPGTNTADAAQQETAPERDMQKEWQALINGEFKDYYTRDTQNMINKRFRENKTAEETGRKYRALAEKVAARYGVDAADVDALSAAIDGDRGFLQEQADKLGMTEDTYRQWTQNKADAQRYQQLMHRQAQEAEQARRVAALEAEAEAMRGKYQGAFDLDRELANEDFVDLMRRGLSMERAWQTVHHDELVQAAAAQSAEAARQQVVDRIQARGMRPKEGAAGKTPAVVHKPNVRELTKQDREEIERRVMHGHSISFG